MKQSEPIELSPHQKQLIDLISSYVLAGFDVNVIAKKGNKKVEITLITKPSNTKWTSTSDRKGGDNE